MQSATTRILIVIMYMCVKTASVWTDVNNPESAEAFNMFTNELEAGTVFLNRCDFLDPALAWTGVKNSGRGVSLSTFGGFISCDS